jgi:hypothetical protein
VKTDVKTEVKPEVKAEVKTDTAKVATAGTGKTATPATK